MEENEDRATRRNRRRFLVGAILAALILILLLALSMRACSPSSEARDSDALVGQLDNKSPEEVQDGLDRLVEEGMFSISIASVIEFPDGASEGELRIENSSANRYLMKVVIALDENGDVVYESGVIEPNHYLPKARLGVDLKAGTYPCTATFIALDSATEQEVGRAEAKVTLVVHT